MAAMMGMILASSGCIMAVGPHLLPSRTRVVHRDQAVQVTSEPAGVDVMREGVVVGKTPTAVELQYDETIRLRDCRFTVPLAILDFALAGVALWGGYSLYKSNRDAERGTPEALYNTTGLLGMVLAVPYAIATLNALGSNKSKCREDPKVTGRTSRPYDFHLAIAGSEERLSIVAPAKKKKFNVVFRELEDKKWRTAIDTDDEEQFRLYLDEYPSGRRRAQAKDRIEELTWRKAGTAGTATAYWGYLHRYPSGRRHTEAERALETVVGVAPETASQKTLRGMVLGDNSVAQTLGASALLRQGAYGEVRSILADRSIDRGKRRGLVKSLGVAMQSGQAAAARDILCRFADSRKKLAAILQGCDTEFASPECDFWEAVGYRAEGTNMALCRSDMSGTSCVFHPTPEDCAKREGRRRCRGDTRQELEVVEVAAEVGQCQEK